MKGKGDGGNRNLKARLAKWLDEFKLAGLGILGLTKQPRFWVIFAIVFVVFGTLLSMFASGFSAFNLFFASDFGGKMSVIASAFCALFGVGRSFGDFLLTFTLTVLQALLIAMIVMIYRYRREKQRAGKWTSGGQADAVQNAGIAAFLALLGSGCPTCGTTLITPLLSAVVGGGSYAIAGTVSGIITAVAIIIMILSIKKLGVESYVIMLEKRRAARLSKKEADGQSN
ncbi:hypothetical protein IKD60_00605 [Candidatus Saccharibacteria bacterium]|nr:hypothetical protein [Candidatus Saccharibacteria bacterium]